MDRWRSKVEQIRAILAASGRPYSADAKRAAIEYAKARRRAGVGLTAVGQELRLSPATVLAWLRPSALVPVEIVANVAAIQDARPELVLVDTRRGLRVEGLNVQAVAYLLERLP